LVLDGIVLDLGSLGSALGPGFNIDVRHDDLPSRPNSISTLSWLN
jgi:hypothetical protein